MIKTLQEFKDYSETKWIYEEAKKKLSFDDSTVIFTGNNNIYCNQPLPPWLIAHEMTHIDRQNQTEGGYKMWWRRYFDDIDFKYLEELIAHRVELQEYKKYNGRELSRKYAKVLLARMNSKLYKFPYKTSVANLTDISAPIMNA